MCPSHRLRRLLLLLRHLRLATPQCRPSNVSLHVCVNVGDRVLSALHLMAVAALTPGTQSPSALSMTSLAPSSPRLGGHVNIDTCFNTERSRDVDLDSTGLSNTVAPSGGLMGVKSTTEVSQSHLFVSQKSSPGRLLPDESESPARLTLRSAFCSMRHQILSRAFCGWLAHCKNMSTIRTYLKDLVRTEPTNIELTIQQWSDIRQRSSNESTFDECCRFVYLGGIQMDLRPQVWPYLLGFHRWTEDEATAAKRVQELTLKYKSVATEWMTVDAIAREKDREAFKIAVRSQRNKQSESKQTFGEICNDIEKFDMDNSPASDTGLWSDRMMTTHRSSHSSSGMTSWSSSTPASDATPRSPLLFDSMSSEARPDHTEYLASLSYESTSERSPSFVGVTDKDSLTINSHSTLTSSRTTGNGRELNRSAENNHRFSGDGGHLNGPSSLEESNVYSNYGVPCFNNLFTRSTLNFARSWFRIITKYMDADYAYIMRASCLCFVQKDLVDLFAVNIHRIDKDVHRCDRNHPYFTSKHNLEKLRNVMCTYAWEHLETGYIQGMCDLAAPLLVVFDDEVLTYGCFIIVMNRLIANFPNGQGMESNLICLRSLSQVMDPELFDLMQRNGDSNHFYFCYRWLLLDFKRDVKCGVHFINCFTRKIQNIYSAGHGPKSPCNKVQNEELVYEDIFFVWEVIWAASRVASRHFVLFIALATIETYRDVILQNNMDFTDIIKFFNGLGDRHGENILLDTCAGHAMHVDFNCLFDRGQELDVPEQVPFRLTHNMVDAMGPLGYEGPFRKTCEATMRVLRSEKETLRTVLATFLYDPLVEWRKHDERIKLQQQQQQVMMQLQQPQTPNQQHANHNDTAKEFTSECVSDKAQQNLKNIDFRLSGCVALKPNIYGTSLSVEAQISHLIRQATDPKLLSKMYVGWAPYM